MTPAYRIGLDIGSTTIKLVVLDSGGNVCFTRYERHHAKIQSKLTDMLAEANSLIGDTPVKLYITGSVGMGVAEKCDLPFVQEVIAATHYIRHLPEPVSTLIDIGGEDAKVVFFDHNQATDLRMNGNCAGGTGAFIDQMAILLGVSTEELNKLALHARQIHPIASRCGVFSKTDIQNLIAKNANREDIAASVFHAVAVQVVVTLAHGCDITAPILFCGGPLTFLSALRKAFTDYLHLHENEVVLPRHSHLIPAWGAALSDEETEARPLQEIIATLHTRLSAASRPRNSLDPIFKDDTEYALWKQRIEQHAFREKSLRPGKETVTLGIDSGSTTTKIVILNQQNELLYTYYHDNDGSPIETVHKGVTEFIEACHAAGTEIDLVGSCSTGYGEDLIRTAFHLDTGIIETIAHYIAARHITKDVSFILDIGGQDMKAMFVSGGVISRIEINEACLSGCGSFIETFARSLDYSVEDFAHEACKASHPYDLGTRCTVFMNSKVKQALREGASVTDIAAGLSYSVVKNCLYKVLRLKNTKELGDHVVVQGGTMKNDSVVRAFEKLTGHEAFRSNHPELMGAIGCALFARQSAHSPISLASLLDQASCTTHSQQCHGCENQCAITVYCFAGGNRYYSGNRCEKVFSNHNTPHKQGLNAYTDKLRLLFDRDLPVGQPRSTVGIPRCLNMYEEYPFWHTLLSRCGIQTVLSSPSTFVRYEANARMVMSDNICFPAKLVHSHIQDLISRHVDRILMPFVVFEKNKGGQNSYNCPIVTGYSEVVKSVQASSIPIDTPAITFKDPHLLFIQCEHYLRATFGIERTTIKRAFDEAIKAMRQFETDLVACNRRILDDAKAHDRLTILLAGRPYHTDPLIQHKLSDLIASMGVNVITDDIVRLSDIRTDDVHFVSQWAYTNRILKAAKWAAEQPDNVQCMELTSFGCGPDAFLTDETRNLLKRHGKTLTLLKIDDVSHIGSLKLRVRSAIESLRLASGQLARPETHPFTSTPAFGKNDRRRKIIAPFFTPFFSPLIPPLMKLGGYDVDILPPSDAISCDCGLRYANNEVCYPATLIVGDIVKAFKKGTYSPEDTAVAITQTGGQCRASNYISLIKRALVESGFGHVPVVSVTFGESLGNPQPGFHLNWFKLIPVILNALLYSDSIAKLYYAAVVRETKPGEAARLRDFYLDAVRPAIENNRPKELLTYLAKAVSDFTRITRQGHRPRVGIVGEIYLKFNPFAQKDLTEWLVGQNIEVAPPLLTDFFMQSFVNQEVNQHNGLTRKHLPDAVLHWAYGRIWKRTEQFNRIGSRFPYFTPFNHIFKESTQATKAVSLNAQFGEGWLLPAEVLSLYRQEVNHVVSLQPFGCIANHIVSKGLEKRLKQLCPDLHLLSLDFDSGVSDVNITNRLLLFVHNLK